MAAPRCLCLVNGRSGGGLGQVLLAGLQRSLGPAAVVDLTTASMDRSVAKYFDRVDRFLACGGDGTAAWLLETVRREAGERGCQAKPVGILPLGTGNDLARWLLGGRPADALASWSQTVDRLLRAPVHQLDRWLVLGAGDPRPSYLYLSVGADARIAMHFDTLRRQHPWLFRSAAGNKALYGMLGLLHRPELVPVDWLGRPSRRSPLRSLVLANIGSYAGGGILTASDRSDDGRFEVYGFHSPIDLSCVTRLGRQRRPLARLGAIDFHLRRPMVAQIDGEPLLLAAGFYGLRHGGQVPVLAPGLVTRSSPAEA